MKWLLKILFKNNPYIRILIILKTIYKLLKPIIMDEGFISKQLAEDFGKKFDADFDFSKIKAVGWALELADGKIVTYGVNYLDDKYGDKVPEKFKPAIISVMEGYAYGDYDKAKENISDAINGLVDIPYLDEDFET